MAQTLSNELIQELSKLAKILAENFTPPEFIPGCEITSIDDIDEYATNNGWIEAVCGQHNQQRVRWKSSDPVEVGDFVDVLFFQDRGIFEAYGVGGSTAVAGSGITALTGDVTATGPGSVAATIANDAVTNAKAANMAESTIKGRAAAAGTGDPTDLTAAQVATILAGLLNSWPRPGKVNIGVTEYSSIGAAITASIAGDILKIGEGTFAETITVNKSIALIALDPNTTIISTSTNDAIPVTITAAAAMINIQAQQTGAGTTGYACEVSTAGSIQAWNCIFSKPSGASTTAAGIKISSVGSTGSKLKYCLATALAGTTKHGLWTSKNAEVIGGKYQGSTASIKVDNSATLDLAELPRLSATLYDAAAGTILGMFVDSNGDLYNLGLTASRAMVTDANKKVVSAAVTATELGYVSGVTSSIQTQISAIAGGLTVKNTSGATVAAGDVGYLTWTSGSGAEFKTTTTANDNKIGSVAVVTVGAANNSNITVSQSGRFTIPYAGSAPAAGDFLVFSTTAAKVALQTTMSPDVLAIAMAAGAGGTVDALLYAKTTIIAASSATRLYSCINHSTTAFTATINGAPSATSVTYNAPSAGNEDVIKPQAAGQLAKAVLWNTTRGTARLIDDVNTGTNVITTVASTDAWASGDTITIVSQTVTTGLTAKAIDIDLSQQSVVPVLARAVVLTSFKFDSGAGALTSALHPLETYAASKQKTIYNQVANIYQGGLPLTEILVNRRFTYLSNASGTGTAQDIFDLAGYWIATP